jgi:glycosyltransferase involved in cell wall biosynthesis
MCPIYAISVCAFAKIFKKKIYLWHNHQIGVLITRFAIKIVDKVFYTSPFSFAAGFKKSSIMPAGIDIENFKRDYRIQKDNNSLLFLGRISKVKNFDVLIKAVKLLDEQKVPFLLNVVGEPGEEDKIYFEKITQMSKDLQINGKIRFLGKLPNYKTPAAYNRNQIFINLTPSGSFDKTILEAMACETLVIVSNKSFKQILPDELIFEERNANDLKNKIVDILNMSDKTKKELTFKLRDYAVQNHNIDVLIKKLIYEFQIT